MLHGTNVKACPAGALWRRLSLAPLLFGVWHTCPAEVLRGIFTVTMSHNHSDAGSETFTYSVTNDQGLTRTVETVPRFRLDPLRLDGMRVALSGTTLTVAGPAGKPPVTIFRATDVDVNVADEPGARLRRLASALPTDSGRFGALFALPRVAINATLLPNGKVLFWGRDGDSGPTVTATTTYLWDPATNLVSSPINNDHTYLFCSGNTLLADGTLFTAGGHVGEDATGSIHTDKFNRLANVWTAGPNMNNGRWYPSAITLNNGNVFISGGSVFIDDGGATVFNNVPQVYQLADNSLRTLSNAQISYGYYPWTFLAPNGRVFVAGPDAATRYINTAGAGAVDETVYLQNGGYRGYGSAVLYDLGKILVVGGPNKSSAETINLREVPPTWRFTGSMGYARMYANATLLPDGTVFVAGGTSATFNDNATAVLPTEIWDPATGLWTTTASISKPRIYHGLSLLLRDGRVLVAGGGQPAPKNGGVDNFDAQLYSPPYLFKGTRPAISSVAGTMDRTTATQYVVGTDQAASIRRVSLIRLGSATHNFDMNQRIHFPSFSRGTTDVTINLPLSATILPPGHYMLFLVNSSGVPSVARIVRVI